MNRKQKICLWIGIVAIVIMGLFPPWVLERGKKKYLGYDKADKWEYTIEPGPYSWIGDPPTITKNSRLSIRPKFVDLYRLGIQYFVVAVVIAGLIITLGDKKDKKEVS